jgi:hypothetical protein
VALEDRWGLHIDPAHPVVTYMADYCAYLLNRLEVGVDGKTGYERVKGKKANVLGIEFGEKLLWKVRRKNKMAKLDPRWEEGVFVGVRRRSGEVWIATANGLKSARSVKRLPMETRWSPENIEMVKFVPWNRYKEDQGADGEIPGGGVEAEPIDRPAEPEGGLGRTVVVDTQVKEPRKVYITKADAEKHGYTRGCGGCSSWFKGLSRQPHSDVCRKRFEDTMKESAKVQNTAKRKQEFEDKVNKKVKEQQEEKKVEPKKRKAGDEGMDDAEREREATSTPASSSKDGMSVVGKRTVREDADGEDGDEKRQRNAEAVWVQEVESRWTEDDEENQELLKVAWDDVNGGELDANLVKKARTEEIEYMKAKKIWRLVPRWECRRKMGKEPITTKWVDTNKGTQERPIVRSRLVARDFKVKNEKDREDLFAATPPWEAKRLLMYKATQTYGGIRKINYYL